MPVSMRYCIVALVVALAGAGAAVYFLRSAHDADAVDLRGQKEVSVVLTDKGFVPRDIIVDIGTKVTFTTTRQNQFWPASDPHPTHSTFPVFDPRVPIESGASWSFTFEKPGVWAYHDHIRSYFDGVIYVE